MRTSKEIYHQIRWDPRFDPARFVLGVNVRGTDPQRIPLPAFVPGGDVPWHRVLFIEADGEMVWDRSAGLDRIDSAAVGRTREPRRLRAPFFTADTPYRWDPAHGWQAAPTPAATMHPRASITLGSGAVRWLDDEPVAQDTAAPSVADVSGSEVILSAEDPAVGG